MGERYGAGVSSDHGPVGRKPPETNKAPELSLAASGWLLVVLNPEASLLWLISEVWVRAPTLYITRFWSLVTIVYALYGYACMHCLHSFLELLINPLRGSMEPTCTCTCRFQAPRFGRDR